MPEHAGEPVRVAAAGGADLGQRAHGVGQRVGDQHRRDAEHECPAQRLERLRPVAGDDLVGDREAGRLGPAAVVAAYRVLVDAAAGVGDELARRRRRAPAGRCPTASISTPTALGRDLPAAPGGPRPRTKSAPLLRPGDLLAAVTSAPALRSASASALFRAPPACCTTRTSPRPGPSAWSRIAGDGVLARLVGALQHDHPCPRRTATGSARGQVRRRDARGPGTGAARRPGRRPARRGDQASTARSTSSSSSPSDEVQRRGRAAVADAGHPRHRRAPRCRDVTRLPDPGAAARDGSVRPACRNVVVIRGASARPDHN